MFVLLLSCLLLLNYSNCDKFFDSDCIANNTLSDGSVLSECKCGETQNTLTCYGSSLNSNETTASGVFDKIGQRNFSTFYFMNYNFLPSGFLSKAKFSLNFKNRVFISLNSIRRVRTGAFNPLGSESYDFTKIQIDINFMTAVNLALENGAFSNLNCNELKFSQIKSSASYVFNLNSLNGAAFINNLIFESCNTMSDLVVSNSVAQNPAKVANFYISGSNLTKLSNVTFNEKIFDLSNFSSIVVSYSGVQTVDSYTFFRIKNLKSLDLSGNKLKSIDQLTLYQQNSLLEKLDLGFNQIEYISVNAFKSLTALKELRLIGNYLKSIPDNIFNSINNLKILNLLGSKNLTTFDWQSILPNNQLTELDLSYLNSKDVLFHSNNDDLLQINTIFNRLETIKLFGYNFTDQDYCKIYPTNEIKAFVQLNLNVPCNCFVIQIYQIYKKSRPNWNLNTPSCYRRIFNTSSLIQMEKTCNLQNENVCSRVTQRTTTKANQNEATTIAQNNEVKSNTLSQEFVIGVSILGGIILVLIISFVVVYKTHMTHNFKRTSNDVNLQQF